MGTKTAIVILNWNGQKLLERFLSSVTANSLQEGAEIIVADNGSTDGSAAFIRENFPEVRFLPLNRNYGFARGYNEALRQIEADCYILLNSDVEVTAGWIGPLIAAMEKDPEIAAVQPKVKSWKEKEKFEYAGAAGGFLDRFGFPLCRGRVLDITEKDYGQYDQAVPVFWATGACMAVRANLYHEAGGFDTDFWAHMEEIDLCWRFKNQGYRVCYTPESTVFHLGGGSLPYDSPQKLFLNFRNSLFMLYKNLPPGKLRSILFFRRCLDGMAALKFLAAGNFKATRSVWKAHRSFCRALPELRQKRKLLEEKRKKSEHAEMFRKSIGWQFYVLKKKTFNQIINR